MAEEQVRQFASQPAGTAVEVVFWAERMVKRVDRTARVIRPLMDVRLWLY